MLNEMFDDNFEIGPTAPTFIQHAKFMMLDEMLVQLNLAQTQIQRSENSFYDPLPSKRGKEMYLLAHTNPAHSKFRQRFYAMYYIDLTIINIVFIGIFPATFTFTFHGTKNVLDIHPQHPIPSPLYLAAQLLDVILAHRTLRSLRAKVQRTTPTLRQIYIAIRI